VCFDSYCDNFSRVGMNLRDSAHESHKHAACRTPEGFASHIYSMEDFHHHTARNRPQRFSSLRISNHSSRSASYRRNLLSRLQLLLSPLLLWMPHPLILPVQRNVFCVVTLLEIGFKYRVVRNGCTPCLSTRGNAWLEAEKNKMQGVTVYKLPPA
jgi:hypothetical protein